MGNWQQANFRFWIPRDKGLILVGRGGDEDGSRGRGAESERLAQNRLYW
jgi:hypothetical protein